MADNAQYSQLTDLSDSKSTTEEKSTADLELGAINPHLGAREPLLAGQLFESSDYKEYKLDLEQKAEQLNDIENTIKIIRRENMIDFGKKMLGSLGMVAFVEAIIVGIYLFISSQPSVSPSVSEDCLKYTQPLVGLVLPTSLVINAENSYRRFRDQVEQARAERALNTISENPVNPLNVSIEQVASSRSNLEQKAADLSQALSEAPAAEKYKRQAFFQIHNTLSDLNKNNFPAELSAIITQYSDGLVPESLIPKDEKAVDFKR